MIAWLSGKVRGRDERSVTLDVGGVGYQIACTSAVLAEAELGSERSYHTYLHVTETALELYGFNTPQELGLFRQLITVSGVGPRVGLAILSVGTPAQVASAIVQSNVSFLCAAPGVGRKIAERVTVDLRDKLTVTTDEGGLPGDDGAVAEALVRLGYRAKDVHEALRSLSSAAADPSARLKEALQRLSRNKWS